MLEEVPVAGAAVAAQPVPSVDEEPKEAEDPEDRLEEAEDPTGEAEDPAEEAEDPEGEAVDAAEEAVDPKGEVVDPEDPEEENQELEMEVEVQPPVAPPSPQPVPTDLEEQPVLSVHGNSPDRYRYRNPPPPTVPPRTNRSNYRSRPHRKLLLTNNANTPR